ncbi:DUF4426 domain-containing protein [Kangiella sediminilitoris]|uniref:DUF4426 domain-containing protein n=1 Tax=Kangiella sediminilitoris TaxID=1144748 RepID=A0A1B3BDP9_9GAMM|nr:DUF4426 domain-containing protein [Kangiella sediminilitoris]AOE50883.1 hypothetical protein KS2013_2178 [Kangiella sediminilitoris]
MRHTTQLITTAIVGFVLTCVSYSSSAGEKRVDDYIIHYNAFNSSFIQPETAVQYKIQRSKYTGLLNVSVHKVVEGGKDKALKVALYGKATNNLSQYQELGFKEIIEGDAVYYLADFQFRDEESMDLEFTINIPGRDKPVTIQLDQKFYAD